jgi:hypothetical protein
MAGFKTSSVVATTAAVAARLVASANMKVGAYTVANGGVAVWPGGFKVTVTQVADTADTMGTVAFVGKDLFGNAITDTLIPVADSTVTGTKIFSIVSTITGAGWVIAGNNDTLSCGVAADSYVATGGGYISKVIVDVLHATAFTISDSSGVLATYPASLPVGTYPLDLPFSGFLKIATTNANGIRVIHTTGVPSTYAMA